jgi:DNA invertase Pin-like site-specific DNA recombinase
VIACSFSAVGDPKVNEALPFGARHRGAAGRCRILSRRVRRDSTGGVRRGRERQAYQSAALTECRLRRATLVVAKLDRLARDAHFLLGLERSGIAFTAADMPNANRLTVGIMAMVAEGERRAISERTKAALAAAKARGVKLGGQPESLKNKELGRRQRAAKKRRAKAAARAKDLAPVIEAIRAQGITSATGIAKALNERRIPTARAGKWQAVQVQRLLST